MPLAVGVVDEVVFYKLPTVDGFFQRLFIAEVLIQVQVADDVLGLYPPMQVAVCMVLVDDCFVYQRAVAVQPFVGCMGNVLYKWFHPLKQCLVAQLYGCFVNQPGGFDVVAIGQHAVLAVPIVVEEEFQVAALTVQNLLDEQQDEVPELLLQPLVFPNTVEVGVWLKDVQMGVHCLALVLVFFAEAHIGNLFPLAGEGFEIAVLFGVEAVLLDRVEQADGIVQCLFIARCAGIFAQSIDGKS